MCMFIVLYPQFRRLYNFNSWYQNCLLCSLISSEEKSRFAHFCRSHSQSLQLSSLVPWSTHQCWEACQPLLRISCIMTREPVTRPSTNRAQRFSSPVIWWELVTTRYLLLNSAIVAIVGRTSYSDSNTDALLYTDRQCMLMKKWKKCVVTSL